MSLLQTFHIALGALGRTKTRSFLTVLGVIIGVAAVIAMVSVGEGAKAKVAKTFESMGTDTLIVMPGSSRRGGVRRGAGSQSSLTWDDMAAIASEVPLIAKVAPELRTSGQVVSDSGNWATTIYGVTPTWFEIRNLEAAQGAVFGVTDQASAGKVAVIGKTVSDALFGENADAVGQTIRINRVPFEVIGVAEVKGASAFGSDNDDRILVPATTYNQKIAGGLHKYVNGVILASAVDADATAEAKLHIEELLRTRHKIRPDAEDDFHVRDPSEIAKAQAESADTITSLLAGVALVSLLVGGIGIMNIMLVSVTERTREIGLRMAVGAKQIHVLAQFLVEAVVLSVVGGILGIAAGIATAQHMASKLGFPLVINSDIVVLAVVVSAAVGIAFGLYPARKASLLDPIAALRYE